MTVIFSKKCEIAIQAMLYLSIQDKSKKVSAKEIADYLEIPKEFTAKILQFLAVNGLINSQKGKNGGFFLNGTTMKKKLIDVVVLIDGEDIFNKCVLGFPGCNNERPCPVHAEWGEIRNKTYQMLSDYTLEELRNKSQDKLLYLKKLKI